MAYPSYYHTMARRLGLPFWLVLGDGGYDRPITAPVGEVAALVGALLAAAGSDVVHDRAVRGSSNAREPRDMSRATRTPEPTAHVE